MKIVFRIHFAFRIIFSALAFLLLTAHTSCEEVKPRQWNDPIPMALTLGEPPHSIHTPFIAAQFQNYYKKSGLKVKIDLAPNTRESLKRVAEGTSYFALVDQAQLIAARVDNLPVVSVAAVIPSDLHAVIAAEGVISSPKELEKMKVGYSGDATEQAVVKAMVESAGGDGSKVQFVNVGSDGIDALLQHKVSALSKASVYRDLLLLDKNGFKAKTFEPVKYGVPAIGGMFLVTSEDHAKNNKLPIKAFIESVRKGEEYTRDNTEKASVMLISQESTELPLEGKTELASLQLLLPFMTADKGSYEPQTAEQWKMVSDWMYKQGIISKSVDPKEAYTNL
ncbi:ABC transporter substrate-binding protein [Paenibacillus allorhizosphaerae]|uniref:Formylaminopyrimidine-binding protein n=1 Tax=Paenibacillus allorhizosphaerae TaxID=2849866 RepID=A0ABN7TGZ9_9BACL|nr:ABC transporter substrate-binding protein [Paenibacillus allorhizosphaerae]CAG7622575.1 Formylaminopyrimidine-binding protein [Paenibacillus allorhizosphaerae]